MLGLIEYVLRKNLNSPLTTTSLPYFYLNSLFMLKLLSFLFLSFSVTSVPFAKTSSNDCHCFQSRKNKSHIRGCQRKSDLTLNFSHSDLSTTIHYLKHATIGCKTGLSLVFPIVNRWRCQSFFSIYIIYFNK